MNKTKEQLKEQFEAEEMEQTKKDFIQLVEGIEEPGLMTYLYTLCKSFIKNY